MAIVGSLDVFRHSPAFGARFGARLYLLDNFYPLGCTYGFSTQDCSESFLCAEKLQWEERANGRSKVRCLDQGVRAGNRATHRHQGAIWGSGWGGSCLHQAQPGWRATDMHAGYCADGLSATRHLHHGNVRAEWRSLLLRLPNVPWRHLLQWRLPDRML